MKVSYIESNGQFISYGYNGYLDLDSAIDSLYDQENEEE